MPLFLQFIGRQLPEEEIMFGSSRCRAGPQADWSRDATREKVITAVPLRQWVVVYTKRDSSKAHDFVSMMQKVCPQMGIDVTAPTRFELRDDRVETYIRALRENINPNVGIGNMFIVLPNLYISDFAFTIRLWN